MGLTNQKCDSCEEKTDVLFPVAILDEMPTGGTCMVVRYYCYGCRTDLETEAESMDSDDEDKPTRPSPHDHDR